MIPTIIWYLREKNIPQKFFQDLERLKVEKLYVLRPIIKCNFI